MLKTVVVRDFALQLTTNIATSDCSGGGAPENRWPLTCRISLALVGRPLEEPAAAAANDDHLLNLPRLSLFGRPVARSLARLSPAGRRADCAQYLIIANLFERPSFLLESFAREFHSKCQPKDGGRIAFVYLHH